MSSVNVEENRIAIQGGDEVMFGKKQVVIITKYIILEGKEHHVIEASCTKKQLEELLKKYDEVHEGDDKFRPIKFTKHCKEQGVFVQFI